MAGRAPRPNRVRSGGAAEDRPGPIELSVLRALALRRAHALCVSPCRGWDLLVCLDETQVPAAAEALGPSPTAPLFIREHRLTHSQTLSPPPPPPL
ncbi:hypothetical protein TD95_002714 [Thielaviopsis punctulata]|uniref:Uncharacterized protein n=1 Tax=Thielaviopsis punctulata TaxID=72032 RepID=A0A0F4Z7D7_9PEZI|nr:hypothetical protein TD95_002714 [Thielaviopsis punctulata]